MVKFGPFLVLVVSVYAVLSLLTLHHQPKQTAVAPSNMPSQYAAAIDKADCMHVGNYAPSSVAFVDIAQMQETSHPYLLLLQVCPSTT